jgi:hypothetical protein
VSAPPKEKRGCYTALTTDDAEGYTWRELRQPKMRRLMRQRLAHLQMCTSLDRFERHVVRIMLRRRRLRILEKDLINRLYCERLEETA